MSFTSVPPARRRPSAASRMTYPECGRRGGNTALKGGRSASTARKKDEVRVAVVVGLRYGLPMKPTDDARAWIVIGALGSMLIGVALMPLRSLTAASNLAFVF